MASSSNSSELTTKRKRTCKFNSEWLQCEDYAKWLRSVKDDDEVANYVTCNLRINIKWDGVKAIKAHMAAKKQYDFSYTYIKYSKFLKP